MPFMFDTIPWYLSQALKGYVWGVLCVRRIRGFEQGEHDLSATCDYAHIYPLHLLRFGMFRAPPQFQSESLKSLLFFFFHLPVPLKV